ncbi:MAG: hypothetical protein SF187_21945 [Deltaproteobacteria bacterium]|nr:hypothetical protein [Deltaproteobacteria bacterium]
MSLPLPAPSSPQILKWVVRASLILVLLAAPWPGLGHLVSVSYAALANQILDRVSFGERGHARLRPASDSERLVKEAVATDTVVQVTVNATRGELLFGISVRRDVHIPLALLGAVALTAPVHWRAKRRALLLGAPLSLLTSLGLLYIAIANVFAERLATIFVLSPGPRWLLMAGHEVLVLPPANRFVWPVVLALALLWWPVRCARAACICAQGTRS